MRKLNEEIVIKDQEVTVNSVEGEGKTISHNIIAIVDNWVLCERKGDSHFAQSATYIVHACKKGGWDHVSEVDFEKDKCACGSRVPKGIYPFVKIQEVL